MRDIALAVAFVVLCGGSLRGAPHAPNPVDQLVDDYFALRATEAYPSGLSSREAVKSQREFVSKLSARLGKRVGYKVGLINREAQEKYGVDAPVRGVLLSRMLLENGAELPANFGVHPICEADLIVVVKDKGINKARTPLEVAQHLKEVVAFIELPDAFLASNRPVDGALLTAINVGARFGVLGQRLPIAPSAGFVTALEDMSVVIADQTGAELGRAPGRTILDNPLNAILWLTEEMAKSGEKLKAGDLISLGALKVLTPQANQTITVRYEGLPGGTIKASVRFK